MASLWCFACSSRSFDFFDDTVHITVHFRLLVDIMAMNKIDVLSETISPVTWVFSYWYSFISYGPQEKQYICLIPRHSIHIVPRRRASAVYTLTSILKNYYQIACCKFPCIECQSGCQKCRREIDAVTSVHLNPILNYCPTLRSSHYACMRRFPDHRTL